MDITSKQYKKLKKVLNQYNINVEIRTPKSDLPSNTPDTTLSIRAVATSNFMYKLTFSSFFTKDVVKAILGTDLRKNAVKEVVSLFAMALNVPDTSDKWQYFANVSHCNGKASMIAMKAKGDNLKSDPSAMLKLLDLFTKSMKPDTGVIKSTKKPFAPNSKYATVSRDDYKYYGVSEKDFF